MRVLWQPDEPHDDEAGPGGGEPRRENTETITGSVVLMTSA